MKKNLTAKQYCIRIAISLGHAILMLAITILLQYTGNIRFDEVVFFKVFAIGKHNIFRSDIKPVKDSVIFLDISKDQVMVDDTALNYGRVNITDRAMLAGFFSQLNQHPDSYKAVICDIAFNYPSPDDTALKPVIEKAKRVFIPVTLVKGKALAPLFRCKAGATDYTVNDGDFVKYPLFYTDSLKSLPLLLAEDARKEYQHHNGLTFESHRLTFNTVIPEFYYRNIDLTRDSLAPKVHRRPNLFYLGEILPSRDFFNQYLKDKYIVVGDFTNDNHDTYLGKMPGPLIVFDTYLTLRENSLALSWTWVIVLMVVFAAVSYHLFYGGEKDAATIAEKVKVSFIREFIKKYLGYLGILILLNILSYWCFGIFISFFYLATYLTIVHTLVQKLPVFRRTKKLSDLLNS